MLNMFKQFAAVVIALALFVSQALPAFACGALVAPNGAIRLSRAATLVAWHAGIERYMTSFTYQGRLTDGGSPASGAYDLQFVLFDAAVGGSQVGPILARGDVPGATRA